MKLWVKMVICVLVMNALGGAGAFLTSGAIENWYETLKKPPGVPPNWVFGPVWTVLYAMIGISFALFWHRVPSGPAKQSGLVWFFVQLVLNLAWTPLFFGAHQIGVALIVIAVLLGTIIVTVVLFRKQDRLAGRLLIPYGIWVGYATYLNAGYWVLN